MAESVQKLEYPKIVFMSRETAAARIAHIYKIMGWNDFFDPLKNAFVKPTKKRLLTLYDYVEKVYDVCQLQQEYGNERIVIKKLKSGAFAYYLDRNSEEEFLRRLEE